METAECMGLGKEAVGENVSDNLGEQTGADKKEKYS